MNRLLSVVSTVLLAAFAFPAASAFSDCVPNDTDLDKSPSKAMVKNMTGKKIHAPPILTIYSRS